MAKRHKVGLSTSVTIKDGKAADIRYNPWLSPEHYLEKVTGIQRVEGALPTPVGVGSVYALYWFVGGTANENFVPYNPQIGQADALIYAGFSFNTDKTEALLNGTKWRISDIPFTLQIPVTFEVPEADATGLLRADIIYVDYNGQAHYAEGVAGATAVAPDLPYKHILVTTIYVSLTEIIEVPNPVEYPDVKFRSGMGDPVQLLGIAGDSYLNIEEGEKYGEIWFKDLLVDEVATWEKKYTPASGSGVPDGGTTGQVLKKRSNTDGDADWQDDGGGGEVSVATEESAGIVELATIAEALERIDDQRALTALKTIALILDENKNFEMQFSMLNQRTYSVLMRVSGSLSAIESAGISSLRIKNGLAGTFAAPTFPYAYTGADRLFFEFVYDDTTESSGNLILIGRDN